MIDVFSLTTIASAFFVIAVAPGPATLGCAAISMAHGRRAGLGFGLGLGMGLTFWGVLAAVGLGAVLAASAQMLTLLKLVGAGYLFWLAWQSGRSVVATSKTEAVQTKQGRWVWKGLLLNLSNPKAVFAWLATLSLGLAPDAGILAVSIATILCAAIGYLVYLPWIYGFSHPPIMAVYRRIRRWVDGGIAVLFAAAGFGLVRSALARAPG